MPRELYGDEQEGLSQVVASEFANVIESITPGFMRVFTSTDDVAEFTPAAPGEERWAREASQYVSYVFMRQNDGFRILYWLIKDALITASAPSRSISRRTVRSLALPFTAFRRVLPYFRH